MCNGILSGLDVPEQEENKELIMKNRIVLLVAFLTACYGNVQERDIVADDNGVADPRFYKGLHIWGKLRVPNRVTSSNETPFELEGKLDIDELQATILSFCRDEILETQGGSTGGTICFVGEKGRDVNEVNISDSSCDAQICSQSLYICAGHMNLKLAEAVAPVSVVARLPEYSLELPSGGNQFAFEVVPKFQNGLYLFNNTFHTLVSEEEGTPCGERCSCMTWEGKDGCKMEYTIPPQSPENRILLLMAAKSSFEMAGIAGMRILEGKGFESDDAAAECLERVVTKPVNKKSHTSADGPSADLPSVFVREFGEIQASYIEIGEKLKNAQVAVATNHDNNVVGYEESWGGDNAFSRRFAAETIVGTGVIYSACIQGIENDAVKAGIDFLRASKDPSILDKSIADIREVGQNAMTSIYADLTGCLGVHCIELEEYLDHMGISLSDLQKARKYIIDEQAANDRKFNTTATKSGTNRLHSLSEKSLVHPAAYWESQGIGKNFETAEEDYESIKGTFPRRSSVEFLNAMRNASNRLLSNKKVLPGISPDVLKRYRALSYIANTSMGDRKVVLSTVDGNIVFNLLGEFERNDKDLSTEKLYVVLEESDSSGLEEDSGYRCAIEGSIDGAPCQMANYIQGTSNSIVASGQVAPFKEAIQVSFSPYVDTSTGRRTLISSPKVWLFTKKGGDAFKLVAGFDTKALATAVDSSQIQWKSFPSVLGNIAIEVPVNTPYSKGLLDPMMARVVDNCRQPKHPLNTETGWSFSLPNDYVPPLEKETIDNSDAYENSWRHYLNEARKAADRADQAGEALIDKGLEIDDRTALSAETCASICGGVVNPDAFGDGSNTGIDEECWSYDATNVALGSYGLCRYHLAESTSGVDLDWCECPQGEKCPECPALLSVEGETCEKLYTQYLSGFPSGYEATIEYVPEALNVYNSNSENISGYLNCGNVREYRRLYRENAEVNGEIFDDMIGKQSWFTQEFFQYLLERYKLDPDPFFHYTVTDFGDVMWSTYKLFNPRIVDNGGVSETVYGCPLRYPYRPSSSTDNFEINCESAKPCGAPLHTFLCSNTGSEITPEEWNNSEWGIGQMGPVGERIIWGTRIGNIFKTMAALGGVGGGIKVPVVTFTTRNKFDISEVYPSGFRYNYKYIGEDGNLAGYISSDIRFPDAEYAYTGYPPEIRDAVQNQKTGEEYAVQLQSGSWGVYDQRIASTLRSKWDILGVRNRRKKYSSHLRTDRVYYHIFKEFTSFEDSTSFSKRSTQFWQFRLGHLEDANNYSTPGNNFPSIKDFLTRSGYGQDRDDYEANLIPDGNSSYAFADYATIKHHYDLDNPADSTWWNGDKIDRTYKIYLTGEKILDALEFACYVAERDEYSCQSDLNPEDINDKEDILKMQRYLNCAADNIHKKAQKLIIPGLPVKLVKRFKAGSTTGLYPNLKGEKLQIYNKIEALLRRFGRSVENIKAVLRESSAYLNSSYYSILSLEKGEEIESLKSLQAIIGQAVQAVNAIFQPNANLGQTLATVAGSAAIGALEVKIAVLTKQSYNAKIQSAIHTTIGQISQKMTELRQIVEQIEDTFSELNSSLGSLESLKTKAARECANATLEDVSSEGHILYPNTVRRRRYQTAKRRYEQDLNNAKEMSYIARKAIEFRLGVDMNKMDNDLTLVEAPKYWVNDLATISGIDYERIRDHEAMATGGFDGSTDEYSHQFIGDYVTKLEQFMESYPIDFRYSNSSDIAVLSLRDDFKVPTDICSTLSKNEIYYSDSIGASKEVSDASNYVDRTVGWSINTNGCVDDSGESKRCMTINSNSSLGTIDSSFCYYKASYCSTLEEGLVIPQAELLTDQTSYIELKQCLTWEDDGNGNSICISMSNCPSDSTDLGEECLIPYTGEFEGFVEQTTDELVPGLYLLSFWHKTGLIADGNGRVEIVNSSGAIVLTEEIIDGPQWSQFKKAVLVQPGGPVTIRLYPSNGTTAPGDILIYGVQLEKIDHTVPGCEGTGEAFNYAECPALPFERTSSTRYIMKKGCNDVGGEQFRKLFERKCVCHDGEPCQSLEVDASCYYELAFALSLEEVESGTLIPSAAISIDNFNYRHGSIALNLVGTNVKQCNSESSTTCYSNAYVTYSLYHDGSVWIKNHDYQHEHFLMPTSKIHNSKALASEIVLTNPLTSNQQSMIAQYKKSEFRGRPINGKYVLRIYEIDGFNFENLEDVQMLWRYNYWTKEH